jgi:hypothetical protein
MGLGSACSGDSDCCNGQCREGMCADPNAMCRTDGSLCTEATECCSNNCLDGACAPEGMMAMCDMTFGPCDTFPECGCAEGQTCHVVDFNTGGRECRTPGSIGAHQPCGTDTYACVANHVCVDQECKQYCEEDRHCPVERPRCKPVGRTQTETIPGFFVCWPL